MNRRSFLTGLIAAPVIVRYGSLMPVKLFDPQPVNMTALEVIERQVLFSKMLAASLDRMINPPVMIAFDRLVEMIKVTPILPEDFYK